MSMTTSVRPIDLNTYIYVNGYYYLVQALDDSDEDNPKLHLQKQMSVTLSSNMKMAAKTIKRGEIIMVDGLLFRVGLKPSTHPQFGPSLEVKHVPLNAISD